MKSSLFSLLAGTALALGLGCGGAAHAQGTWQLGGSSCNVNTTANPDNAVCSAGSVTATMTAWGGSGSAFTQANLGEYDPSGFGAITGTNETGTNGHHGFDNQTTNCGSGGTTQSGCGGAQEFMLISFGSAKVNLNALSIGYSFGDADISLYRWDGNSAAGGAGGTAAAGWSLVAAKDMNGSNDNGGVGSFDVNTETGTGISKNASQLNKYSSWWLISTYAGGFTNSNLGQHGAWKLQSFSAGLCVGTLTGGSTGGGSTTNNNNGSTCNTTTGGAPEPGSLALAGLALAGVFAARRRPLATLRAA